MLNPARLSKPPGVEVFETLLTAIGAPNTTAHVEAVRWSVEEMLVLVPLEKGAGPSTARSTPPVRTASGEERREDCKAPLFSCL
jgi:hypothetical protein